MVNLQRIKMKKTKNKQNPVHQHYVPVFILKNFAKRSGRFLVYDVASKKFFPQPAKKAYAENDFYTIKTNDEDDYEIEKNLSKFESEITPIFRKIVTTDQIELKRSELETLRIFLSLLAFRSKFRKEQYQNQNFDVETKLTLNTLANNQDYVSLWKNEIKALSTFRKYKQIEESVEIDCAIKQEFVDDYKNYYMTIIKLYGQSFILSDVFPTLECLNASNGEQIVLHMIYPLSPTVAIVLNLATFKKEYMESLSPLQHKLVSLSRVNGNTVIEPKRKYKYSPLFQNDEDIFIYDTKKVYPRDAIYINCLILNEVRNNFIFNNKEKLLDVIQRYKNEDGLKQNYDNLELALEKALERSTK